MCDAVMMALASFTGLILGGVISAGTGIFLFRWQRRRSAKDEFHAIIADQRTKLEIIERSPRHSRHESEDAFKADSIDTLIAAIYKIRPFIPRKQWLRLDDIRKEYQSREEQYTGRMRLTTDIITGVPYTKRLRSYFDRLEASLFGS